jgi:hypothetical protein
VLSDKANYDWVFGRCCNWAIRRQEFWDDKLVGHYLMDVIGRWNNRDDEAVVNYLMTMIR